MGGQPGSRPRGAGMSRIIQTVGAFDENRDRRIVGRVGADGLEGRRQQLIEAGERLKSWSAVKNAVHPKKKH